VSQFLTIAGTKETTEGEFIHRKIFGFSAPSEVLRRYNDFVETIATSAAWPQREQVIQADLDVEALEFAFRFRRPHHPLKQRIQGLCFICEAHPAYWQIFYAGKSARVASWFQLALTGVRTIWLLAKGNYLIHRHHLV
jgi:hypothetical protein